MTKQPRDSNGRFIPIEDVRGEGEVEFFICEFEARVIGNRLNRAAERFDKLHSK